jgi:serine/threonine protein phosphatase PrpC
MNIYYTSVKGRRTSNEDKHTIILNLNKQTSKINPINLFGIYDGHGGEQVSKYLSENIPIYYCNPESKPPFSKEYHTAIFESIQKKLLTTDFGHSMGSTCLLNIMYKYKDEYHMNIVNVGDSRLTIVYKDGQSKQITNDHKPDDEHETIRIEKMGGEIYLDSEGVCRIGDLSLSRAFGDGDNAPYISQKPDVYYKKICNLTKYIVMGCDGLWDVVKNEELFVLLEKFSLNKSTENIASLLAEECLSRGCSDNISIIIIKTDLETRNSSVKSELTQSVQPTDNSKSLTGTYTQTL